MIICVDASADENILKRSEGGDTVWSDTEVKTHKETRADLLKCHTNDNTP